MRIVVLVERWDGPGTPVRTTEYNAPDWAFARELMLEFRCMGHRATIVTKAEETA